MQVMVQLVYICLIAVEFLKSMLKKTFYAEISNSCAGACRYEAPSLTFPRPLVFPALLT